jgi:hypothetical protein
MALFVIVFGLFSSIVACVTGSIYQPTVAAAPANRADINLGFGIDLPVGAVIEQLPPGITDYIRRTWPGLLPERPSTNPPLGVDLPVGAETSDLPPGVTDYLRHPAAGQSLNRAHSQ